MVPRGVKQRDKIPTSHSGRMSVEGDEVPARGSTLFGLTGDCCMWSIEHGDYLTGSHNTFKQDSNGLSHPVVCNPSTLAFLVTL